MHACALLLPYSGCSLGGCQAQHGWRLGLLQPLTVSLKSGFKSKVSVSVEHLPVASKKHSESSMSIRVPFDELQQRSLGGGLPILEPRYFTTDELTKRPQPTSEAKLDTPEISKIIAAGKVILQIWVDEFGDVVDVELEKSELPDAFSRVVVEAFKSLRFTPGERYGRRVGVVMKIEVNYEDSASSVQ